MVECEGCGIDFPREELRPFREWNPDCEHPWVCRTCYGVLLKEDILKSYYEGEKNDG